MNVRMGLIRKKPAWSDDDFRAYWRDQHGPLAARAPGLRAYWQNAVTDRLQRGITFARGPWDFDGFSQLWFDDRGQADHAFHDGELAAALVADERHFLGDLHIVTAEQSVVVAVPEGEARGRLLKRISTLKRRADLSEDDFRREWKVHADHVREREKLRSALGSLDARDARDREHVALRRRSVTERRYDSLGAAHEPGCRRTAHRRLLLRDVDHAGGTRGIQMRERLRSAGRGLRIGHVSTITVTGSPSSTRSTFVGTMASPSAAASELTRSHSSETV